MVSRLRCSPRRDWEVRTMSRRCLLVCITLFVAPTLWAAPAARAAGGRPVVTIYSHDLGFVHEWRTLALDGARDTVRIADVPERIDVSSVRLTPAAGRVARLAYHYDVA